MATHWTRIRDAVEQLGVTYPDAAIGMQIFWAEVVESMEEGVAKSNWCGDTHNNVLELGKRSNDALVKFLGDAPPGPAFIGGLFETSPVIEPLNYYLTHTSTLADPTRTNYLVFITDGNDNCFGALFADKASKLLAYQKLAIELGKLNIRILPIGFDAASMPASNGAFGTTPPNTDLEVLSMLLEYGGTGLTTVPKVDDPSKLGAVIEQVGKHVRSCRFQIPSALDPSAGVNTFQLDFSINDQLVARDRHNLDGWNFVAGDTTQVELFGLACEAIRTGQTVSARKSCAQQVCGSAAIKVETRPRAVMYLLDASATRIECVDGSLGCLSLPDSNSARPLSYWEVVEHAVSESLSAPINDDIHFGLQFLPSKMAASFTCDLAPSPEIEPAPGTAISMMSQMLEKLPLGLKPLLQVMENLAATPGKLADPEVLTSIVLLSDGGDLCSTETQETLVTRLEAAAKKLLDLGIKTYVVRYGSVANRTPLQDAQLEAIAVGGGTALTDPSLPKYIDAKSQDDLTQALATISDQLAACSFGVSGLPVEADKTNANLYLNGEVIPFDAAGAKQAGWHWVDAEQTAIELYGDSCTAFKTNRHTNVVVEFGCASILL